MNIIWSFQAKEEIREIYIYYKSVANSKVAKKMLSEIFTTARALKKHKEIGKIEENKNVSEKGYRFLVSGNYKIVYRIIDSKSIFIATIFDCRQNPDKLHV